MAQRGDSVLASRSNRCLQFRIGGDVLGQDLDGDGAIEARVAWPCRPRPCRRRRAARRSHTGRAGCQGPGPSLNRGVRILLAARLRSKTESPSAVALGPRLLTKHALRDTAKAGDGYGDSKRQHRNARFTEFQMVFDLFAEDDWRNVYCG